MIWRQVLKINYQNKSVEKICCDKEEAKKFFDGKANLATSLMARMNVLDAAQCLHDVVVQRQFRFHKLKNKKHSKLEGYFAIDVKNSKEPWRIILRPLNEQGEPYNPCNIDQIAKDAKIIEIVEVSNHYE